MSVNLVFSFSGYVEQWTSLLERYKGALNGLSLKQPGMEMKCTISQGLTPSHDKAKSDLTPLIIPKTYVRTLSTPYSIFNIMF